MKKIVYTSFTRDAKKFTVETTGYKDHEGRAV